MVVSGDTTGLVVNDQQTPLAVIVPPPSEVMLPPMTANDDVTELARWQLFEICFIKRQF